MGYTTKEELMEKVKAADVFTNKEVDFIKKSIETYNRIDNEAILELGTINEMETMGILGKFYKICKDNGFFPKWIENVEKGIDHI